MLGRKVLGLELLGITIWRELKEKSMDTVRENMKELSDRLRCDKQKQALTSVAASCEITL